VLMIENCDLNSNNCFRFSLEITVSYHLSTANVETLAIDSKTPNKFIKH